MYKNNCEGGFFGVLVSISIDCVSNDDDNVINFSNR